MLTLGANIYGNRTAWGVNFSAFAEQVGDDLFDSCLVGVNPHRRPAECELMVVHDSTRAERLDGRVTVWLRPAVAG